MPDERRSDAWVRSTVEELASQHFPHRAKTLEVLMRELADRHEATWRGSGGATCRPTPAMYALALRWELEKLGPNCAFCHGTVEVPSRLPPEGPSGPVLTLGPRASAGGSPRNVPQDLTLAHVECLPGA